MVGWSLASEEVAPKRRKLNSGHADNSFVNEENNHPSFTEQFVSIVTATMYPLKNFWRNVVNSNSKPKMKHNQKEAGIPKSDLSITPNRKRLVGTDKHKVSAGSSTESDHVRSFETAGCVLPQSHTMGEKNAVAGVNTTSTTSNDWVNDSDDEVVILSFENKKKDGLVLNRSEHDTSNVLTLVEHCSAEPQCSSNLREDEEIKLLEEEIAEEDEDCNPAYSNATLCSSKSSTLRTDNGVKIVDDDDVTIVSDNDDVKIVKVVQRSALEKNRVADSDESVCNRLTSVLPVKGPLGFRKIFDSITDDVLPKATEVLHEQKLQQIPEDQQDNSSVLSESINIFNGTELSYASSATRNDYPRCSKNRKDKFSRSKSSESSQIFRLRAQPFWNHRDKWQQSKKYTAFLSGSSTTSIYREDESENVFNLKDRERYRRFLEELKTDCNIVNPPFVSKKNGYSDSSEVLRRGRNLLNQIISGDVTPVSTSSSLSSGRSSVDHRSGRDSKESSENESHFAQGKAINSAAEILAKKASFLQDDKNLDSTNAFRRSVSIESEVFEAKLETEKSNGELARDRLTRYRQEAELRQKRAQALSLEKKLRETARRDEEIILEEEIRKKLTIDGYIFRDRKIKSKKEFPDLSDDAYTVIDFVWYGGNALDEKFGERITRRDLLTLRGLDWLNDEVIDTYFDLICERAKKDPTLPKVYAFTTFFYTNLIQHGYPKVKRWTKKVNIFSYDILLVPVHLGAHWCLAVIDFTRSSLEYYDSMGGTNNRCLDALRAYLKEESVEKRKTKFDDSGWKCYCRKDIPQQMNGSDCGMFACKFAEFASRRAPIVFSQENMPYYRQRMVYEIYQKKLM